MHRASSVDSGGGLYAVHRTREHEVVLPIVIVAALGLALALRWWAVPLVAAGWGVLIANSVDAGGYAAGLALAAVNALVGAVLGIGITRALRACSASHA